jgi:TRAP-type C4-dicarboxylate transport system permease small subunit
MGNLDLYLLLLPFTIPLLVVAGWLIANATSMYARSRGSWIASVLVLPHFASKLMDAGYDAVLAGKYLYAALLFGALLLVIAGLRSLLKTHR